MKEENKINYVTPIENKEQFFNMSINENTIAILSPFLKGKSINAGFSRKDKDFFARTLA